MPVSRKTLRIFMCAAVAAALGMFGTATQATFYGGDFDPFTGTFSLDVSDSCNSDSCTIALRPNLFISSTVFNCCWTAPGQPVGATNETFSEGDLVAFDSDLIPLSRINTNTDALLTAFANAPPPCDAPSLGFTSQQGFDMNEQYGYIAQLVCPNDPTVWDDARYQLTRLTTVPEPGTLALILGGVGAAWLTRRRKAAS
jgi:hypothetical protein